MSILKHLSKHCGTAKKKIYPTYTLSGVPSTIPREFYESRKDRPIYPLYQKPPLSMLTVYFNAKEKDRTLILETNHKPLISLQVIDPIKRSKEPIPVDLIQFKASGDAYDIYRLLFELGKRKAKINFTY